VRYSEIQEEYKKDGTYLIRAMTYENHSPPHELRAFLSIPEVKKELDKLRFVIKNTPNHLLNKIPRAEIVDELLKQYKIQISPRGKQLVYNYLKGNDQYLEEESPDTLNGSFTQDLIDSKKWLVEKLKKVSAGNNVGNIYVLGSWYGNIGLILEEFGINYNKLILVELDKKALTQSKYVLKSLGKKVEYKHIDAEDLTYDKPCVIINTSTDDMDTEWFHNVPKNTLLFLQGRTDLDNPKINFKNLNRFDNMYPLQKTYYLGEMTNKDPETSYLRYMKIGLK
jgi:hypothetical protein